MAPHPTQRGMTMDKRNNSGNSNSGISNSGNSNSGNSNSGDCNSGNWNSGISNSGDWNSGNSNSGNSNSGNSNSGNWNSGNWNSGISNSGNWNNGISNSGDWNSGIFNTDEPRLRAFNEESSITMSEWVQSENFIRFDILLTEWIGNQLVVYDYKEAWSNWWAKSKSEEMTARIKKLPNFDAAIFEEITGIAIDGEPEKVITLSNGAKVSESTITEALKFLAEHGE